MTNNIPIYRAKKIGSDEYIERYSSVEYGDFKFYKTAADIIKIGIQKWAM